MTLSPAVCMALALAGAPAPAADPAERAAELLAQARSAMGGADRLAGINSLTAAGPLRRILGRGDDTSELSGDLRVDVLLPGRFLKVESLSPLPGMPAVSIASGLDGDDAWTRHEAPPAGHGGMVVVRRPPDESAPGAGAGLAARTRAEYARLLLAALLLTDPTVPVTFRHAGVAEAPDGRADVLDVSGPDGLSARLFLDAASHRPLMLSYSTRRGMMVRRFAGGGPPSEAEIQQAAATPVPEVEARLHLEDFRAVGGLLLPHRFTTTFDGQPGEEWQVKEYELNPRLEAERFRKRK